jgi:hypothetical protein
VNAATAIRTAPGSRLRALSVLARTVAGGLVAFHLWLLLQRLADATIGHPEVLLRWVGAAILGAGALAMRRRGLPLLSGRSGLVFWLLVLLLHAGASPLSAYDLETPEILIVLPLGMAAAGAFSFAGRRASPRPRPASSAAPRRGWLDRVARSPRLRLGDLAGRFAPRPPPLAPTGV